MSGDLRARRASEQLRALCNAPNLPDRVRTIGERVRKQLDAPVRLALVGRPGTGKVDLVNGFVRAAALPKRADMPPMILSHGTTASIQVTTADGEDLPIEDQALSAMTPTDMALLKIVAPLPLLERITLLTVPVEGNVVEVRGALDWLAGQADVVVWCTNTVTEEDRTLWRLLPEPLAHHAFLAVLAAPPEDPMAPHEHCFRSVHYLGIPPGTKVHEKRRIDRDALQDLRSTLLTHVSEGRLEDLEGAMIFLDRYQPKHAPQAETPGTDPTDGQDCAAVPVADAPPQPVVSREANAVLRHLIARANDMAEQVATAGSGLETADLLEHCMDTLEGCLDLADPTSPLADGLAEATDLIVLMQLEGTPTAMADAATLLLQMRAECEHPIRSAVPQLEAVS